MTIQEMHIAFNLELKAQGAHEDFVAGEIDSFLNRSIRAFVDERKPLARLNEVALSDLRTLIQSELIDDLDLEDHPFYQHTILVLLDNLENVFEFAIAGRVTIQEDSITKPIRFLSFESFVEEIAGEAHSPVYRRLPATVEGTSLLITHDISDTDIESVYLTYLRPAQEVSFNSSLNSDLPNHTHRTIVTQAVAIARAALAATEG